MSAYESTQINAEGTCTDDFEEVYELREELKTNSKTIPKETKEAFQGNNFRETSLTPNQAVYERTGEDTGEVVLIVPEIHKKKFSNSQKSPKVVKFLQHFDARMSTEYVFTKNDIRNQAIYGGCLSVV